MSRALQLLLGRTDLEPNGCRAIGMLNDLFARNLTHNLAALAAGAVSKSTWSRGGLIQFNEFLLRIPEISYVASVRLEPLGALSELQLDLALAPPVIDLLLGGEGKNDSQRRGARHRGIDPGIRHGDKPPRATRGLAGGGPSCFNFGAARWPDKG